MRSDGRLDSWMEYQLITAFRTGGIHYARPYLKHRCGSKAEGDAVGFEERGDFPDPEFGVQENGIE